MQISNRATSPLNPQEEIAEYIHEILEYELHEFVTYISKGQANDMLTSGSYAELFSIVIRASASDPTKFYLARRFGPVNETSEIREFTFTAQKVSHTIARSGYLIIGDAPHQKMSGSITFYSANCLRVYVTGLLFPETKKPYIKYVPPIQGTDENDLKLV